MIYKLTSDVSSPIYQFTTSFRGFTMWKENSIYKKTFASKTIKIYYLPKFAFK